VKLCWLVVLALAGTCGLALEGQAAEALRLDDAVARALASNPLLAAEAAGIRAADSRSARESLSTPLTLGGELENLAGTGSLSGTGGAETTLRVGKRIELGGKQAARRALGQSHVLRQRNVAASARADVIALASLRFIEVLADQARLAAAKERTAFASRARNEVARWVQAGRNPDSDLAAADITLADAELSEEHAEHELLASRQTLAASWGGVEVDFAQVAGDLEGPITLPSFDSLAARLPDTPGQRAHALEADELSAQRDLARAMRRPDVDLSLGVRRLEGLDDQGLVMSVSVPLGSKVRSTLAVAEADALLAASAARADAARSERHQELFEAFQELNHAAVEQAALSSRMLPRARQALALSQRGFEQGRFAFLPLSQAQRTLFDLRIRQIEAAALLRSRLIQIERLTTSTTDTTP
jgi:cobalt-zinc-cadmium efflux system outer membrane protein